nr:hypothetical protein [uncultured Flavobacterium sp.]
MTDKAEIITSNTQVPNKFRNLIVGIILDLIGNISYVIPGLGEVIDVVWAPLSAFMMNKLYPTRAGKVASVISFIEEAVPGIDFIPSFTIMWFYTYVFKSNK